MKINTKILWAFLGMCLLVALVGALAVDRQRAVAMAGVTREAQDVARLVSFLLLSSSISLMIVLYMRRSIAKPLQQLTDVATGLAAGRTDLPMPPPRGDEIGELAMAFHNMVQKRQRTEDQLRRLRDELEVRVMERTAELAKANDALQAENAERKRAQETARESEEKFSQLADHITDAFWIRSHDMREVHYISPAFERTWGRTMESLYANPHQWADAILPEDRERVRAAFVTLTEAAPSISIEYRIARPDGEVRWVHTRGFQVRNAARELIRLTGIVTDITERKRAQAELENVYRQLLEASRRGGMAEIATNVLHNVGNVLNSVNVSTTLIVDSVKKSRASNLAKIVVLLQDHAHDLGAFLTDDPKGKQVPNYLAQLSEHLIADQAGIVSELNSLQRNVEHIKQVVAMQQNYATVGGVKEMINVVYLVEDSLRMNEAALSRHGVEVIREFEPVPSMNVEKHKLLQILVNLLHNAKHACQESERADKRLTVRVANGEGWVKISVTDNGIGIPPENMTRIFNHGFTTRKGGHGFGLHSSALAAKEMGGSLSVHTDGVGQGATFTLELPCPLREPAHE